MRNSSPSQPLKLSTSSPSEPSTRTEFELASFPIISAPFNGADVFVRLRELNAIQIRSCGDFSLIELFDGSTIKAVGKMTVRQMMEFAKYQNAIVRESLLEPTYAELMEWCEVDPTGHAEQLESVLETLKDTEAGKERDDLVEQINAHRIWLNMILPQDFTGAIMAYALGMDKSDIKRLTWDVLYRASILAKRGHDNPHDHVDGYFTPFNRIDIDTRAWLIFEQERERAKSGR